MNHSCFLTLFSSSAAILAGGMLDHRRRDAADYLLDMMPAPKPLPTPPEAVLRANDMARHVAAQEKRERKARRKILNNLRSQKP